MIKIMKKGVQKAKNPGLGSGGGGQTLSLDLSSYDRNYEFSYVPFTMHRHEVFRFYSYISYNLFYSSVLHLLSDFILKNIFISNAGNHTTNEVIDFRPGGAFLVKLLKIWRKFVKWTPKRKKVFFSKSVRRIFLESIYVTAYINV